MSRRSASRGPSAAPHGLAAGAELAELAHAASEHGSMAVDTEFVGEGRYRTLLCLVQIAVPDGNGSRVAVIDALDETIDVAPLRGVLADPRLKSEQGTLKIILGSFTPARALLRDAVRDLERWARQNDLTVTLLNK